MRVTAASALGGSGTDDRVADMVEAGQRCYGNGDLQQARALCDRILALIPDHGEALLLLAVIALQTGHPEQAVTLVGRTLAGSPAHAAAHNTLGNALRSLGRLVEASGHFRMAIRLRPDSAEIHSNFANLLCDLGRTAEAAAHYRQARDCRPDLPEPLYNLANLLAEQGDLTGAERCYREALGLTPDYAAASYNLGNLLVRRYRLEEAEACYRTALRRQAGRPEVHTNLGMVLQELGRLDEAEACYYAALRLKPACVEALYNLGCLFQARNDLEQAWRCYDHLLRLKPDHGPARLARCMAQLPILYGEEAEIGRRRQAYQTGLEQLRNGIAHQPALARAVADAVGSSQPFFLAYQGQNDRELQRRYGAMVCRALARHFPPVPLAPPPAPGERLRVGIVSGFFTDHTVWRLLIRGWLSRLDRRRFQVFGYHTGLRRDGETVIAAGLSDRFVEGRRSGEDWRRVIAADAPHVLLYPEIGMDPMAAWLAAQRLAPVQCNSWGHPNTSGLPTQDYFLSSELMEPPDGDQYYTERLIRLPNLATCYEPDRFPARPLDRAALGLRPGAVVCWSGQALYKYLPQYDQVFPRIAAAVGDCQFVFIEYAKSPDVTALFRRRLERAFAARGLKDEDHCVFLRPMDQESFIAAVRHSDLVLDTIGWSGGRSTLDCLAHDAPMVTLAGRFMRSRHTAAILRMMDIPETITASLDDYVTVAVLLARDDWWRTTLRTRMAENRHRVFRDRTCVTALETFLEQAVSARPPMTRQGGHASAPLSGDCSDGAQSARTGQNPDRSNRI